MSKIVRQTMKFFGSTAGGNDVGVFGSLKAGSPTYSQVISTIQGLAAWGTGWAAEVTSSGTQANAFALEDMNAFCLVTSYGICYLHEMGIPEWDSATVYYQNSYCQVNGTVYYSLQDSNLNQNPATQTAYWTAGIIGVPTLAVDNVTIQNVANTLSVKNKGIANAQLSGALGAWDAAKSDNTPYLAATDLFVTAWAGAGGGLVLSAYSDATTNPSTLRDQTALQGEVYRIPGSVLSVHVFVRKGDYWKTVGATNIMVMPLGS